MDEILKKIRQFGDSAVGQAQSAYNNYNKGVQNVARTVTAPIRGVAETVGEFTYSPQTLPNDWKYRMQIIADRNQRNHPGLIQIPANRKPSAFEENMRKKWEQGGPKEKFEVETFWRINEDMDSSFTPTKDASAKHVPYNFLAPEEDERGAKIKAQILSNPALYPGAKKYLETIPFSADKGPEDDTAGVFYSGPYNEEYLQYDPNNEGPFEEQVAVHELLHAASNVFGKKELGEFTADVAQAYQANPKYFEPVMKWIQGYKDARKDTNYFTGDPLQEANELFAQIGAMYGPEMANHPILGKYYSKVFDPSSGAAQPQPPIVERYEDGSSRVVPALELERRKRFYPNR